MEGNSHVDGCGSNILISHRDPVVDTQVAILIAADIRDLRASAALPGGAERGGLSEAVPLENRILALTWALRVLSRLARTR
jgi:hypothetical protein